jgi:hypothetical protein
MAAMCHRDRHRQVPFALRIVTVTLAALGALPSQCTNSWLPGAAVPGTSLQVYATTMWDPDGLGPQPPVLVVGGAFAVAGTVLANHVATYDPATGMWSALGTGVDGAVHCLTTLPTGELVVGGEFTTAGGLPAAAIARWNGVSWAPLGSGMAQVQGAAVVRCFATLPNGDLVAGGSYWTAGGTAANNIARWDGATWSAMGAGMWHSAGWQSTSVQALAVLPNGNVVAGGSFTSAGSSGANNLAQWNGTSWSSLGVVGVVGALAVLPNGHLIVGGMQPLSGNQFVLRWNGLSWSSLGSAIASPVRALLALPNGDVVAAGDFSLTTTGGPSNYVARWNGSSWSGFGLGLPAFANAMALTQLGNGDIVVGGSFPEADGVPAKNIARWNGTAWLALGPGTNDLVYAVHALPDGGLVAGGTFTSIDGVSAQRIARWDGATWTPLGSGIGSGGFEAVHALTALPNGGLVAGGRFATAGGIPARNIARWDGTTWWPLGTGVSDPSGFAAVTSFAVLQNGDLVAGGQFTTAGTVGVNAIARWDGAVWSAVGAGIPGIGAVAAMLVLPNGDLLAAGTNPSGSVGIVAKWNGSAWTTFPQLTHQPGLTAGAYALAALPNGDFVVGGMFDTAGSGLARNVARWNGASWSPLGAGVGFYIQDHVKALHTLPDADLVATGSFTPTLIGNARNIVRFDGASWSAVGAGLDRFGTALTQLANGDLVVGGQFGRAGGFVSAHVARLTTTCPAASVAYGSGCVGSGGLNELTPTSLPWLGGTSRSRATGLPTNSIAVDVLGLGQTAIALGSVLPQAVPGCTLWVSPDVLTLLLPTAGVTATQTAIPATAALIGQTFHQQVVPFELDALGQIAAVTGSNALSLTIGAF